ncbi:Lumazine-binding protein [Rickenella mellea]|uniref:Riboflavin synthase n=1 Tax=Rickenella mellea TaxID=50990 RepID=A0A4Y7Q1C5_9AGAM|nr:Lumazine-binding protein [Rickenella mellea]
MFTGLIEHVGTITSSSATPGGCTLEIGNSHLILGDCHVGDSIAVNGACLTVTGFDAAEGWFMVWLANETLARTDLGERKVGDQVNLERAMGAHVRFGGHFVQAHVDTTATITSLAPDGDSLRITFQLSSMLTSPPPHSITPYLIPKGYIAIDGASLTLTAVSDGNHTFEVMLIKHTQEKITLARKRVGESVNVEVDMVGKYVDKSVRAVLEGAEVGVGGAGGAGGVGLKAMIRKVVEEVLSERGHGSPKRTRLPDMPAGGDVSHKAKALYAYVASPNDPTELSFRRDEIFDIVDRQGKWWQVKKMDGTVGIAPSNYLTII